MIYFDSCYIDKFYLAEPDSANVIAFARAHAGVSCLLIGEAEVVAVFHRKLRESIVDVSGFHLLCDLIRGRLRQRPVAMASGGRHPAPLVHTTLSRGLPPATFLPAADALHLTCAAEEGCTAIHTSGPPHDRRRAFLWFAGCDFVRAVGGGGSGAEVQPR